MSDVVPAMTTGDGHLGCLQGFGKSESPAVDGPEHSDNTFRLKLARAAMNSDAIGTPEPFTIARQKSKHFFTE
jgi:hypothetical protein